MDDRTRIGLGVGLGAVLGGFASFLLFTERGKSFRAEIEPQLEEFLGEAQRLKTSFDKTRQAVMDGLATFKPEDGGAGQSAKDWSH